MTTIRRPDPAPRPAGLGNPRPLPLPTAAASASLVPAAASAADPSRVARAPSATATSATSAIRRRAGFVPGPRHVALLRDAGRHGLLTFRQVRRRHFPGACDQTVHRHLKRHRNGG
jgi:hypothetical protein